VKAVKVGPFGAGGDTSLAHEERSAA